MTELRGGERVSLVILSTNDEQLRMEKLRTQT